MIAIWKGSFIINQIGLLFTVGIKNIEYGNGSTFKKLAILLN